MSQPQSLSRKVRTKVRTVTAPLVIAMLGLFALSISAESGQTSKSSPSEEILNRKAVTRSNERTTNALTMIPTALTSQTPSEDRLAQPVRVKLDGVNTPDTVAEALYDAAMPGGIAVLHYCGGFPTRSLRPSSPSLRALLDAVVSADPDYSWGVNEGVVNLIPRHIKLQFLDTRVSKLDLEFKTPDEALNILLALPNVQSQANRELGSRLFQGFPYPYPPGDSQQAKTFSIKLMDSTVTEALNAIAKANGSAVWVLVKNECNNSGRKNFSIKFIHN